MRGGEPFGRPVRLCGCAEPWTPPFVNTSGIATVFCPSYTAKLFPPGVGRITKMPRPVAEADKLRGE